jgi:hypothetical protein
MQRPDPAQLDNRFSTLSMRHRAIDREIAVEQARPAPDQIALRSLKRQKLRVKEEMQRVAQARDFAACLRRLSA